MKSKLLSVFSITSMLGIIIMIALTLNACSAKPNSMPDDTPANNGLNAIMETQDGYYTNLNSNLCIRYYDKKSGKQIFLCGKPECKHDGNTSCTATYKRLPNFNTVLYNDNLYFLALEDKGDKVYAISMFKVSLDGSSVDKIGEVISAKNDADRRIVTKDRYNFIIHRGFAYIPYWLSFGEGFNTFQGGGMVKMNILNGEITPIITGEKGRDLYPENLCAIGDYVYYDLIDGIYSKNEGTYKYNITDGTISKAFRVNEENSNAYYSMYASLITEDFLYMKFPLQEEEGTVISKYSPDEYIPVDGSFITINDPSYICGQTGMMYYNDMIFVYSTEQVRIFNMEGEQIGMIEYEGNTGYRSPNPTYIYGRGYNHTNMFKITNNKLYLISYNDIYSDTSTDNETLYYVYYCPIDDILAGKGEWTKAYDVKGSWSFFPDDDSLNRFGDLYGNIITEDRN